MSLAIFYGRVSTREQGTSGLGLASQKNQVLSWMKSNGFTCFLTFEEVATAKDENRPELDKAIAASKEHGIPIVVAKLDRLSRRVAYIAALMEDKSVSFIAADLGRQVDALVLHIFASFAESERKRISERTKAALQAKKAQGFKLGNPNIAEARKKANFVRSSKANARAYAAVIELLEQMISHHKNVRVRCGLKPVFQSGKYISGFGWMCPSGTFTKKHAIKEMTTKTARGGKWTVVALNRAINRTAANLPKEPGSDLLSLTMANAPLFSFSHTFASRNLQQLEWEGRLVEVLRELIWNIEGITHDEGDELAVETGENVDDDYTMLTVEGRKHPQIRVKRK